MDRAECAVMEKFLKGGGLKVTRARKVVLEAFLELEGHMTAELLFTEVKKKDPGIGQATVFRTVKLLSEAGLAREACQDDGAKTYEHAFKHSHHDHLRCERCGKIVEFCDPTIEKAQEAIFVRYGFTPLEHKMQLIGLCAECAAGTGKPDAEGGKS
ncbi:MAG: transcriptional repressor [Spirochaetes bacterium]|nr:transcriptional repressor [Spirochaetota bacterium]